MSVLIPNPAPSAPYPVVNDALNLARTRLNDAIKSIGGDMLMNDQPFTQVMANAAWMKMRQFLASLGFSRIRRRTVLSGIPIVSSTDPSSECVMTWQSFFDGTSYFIPPNTPVLPQDFISPFRIGERQTANMGVFSPMHLVPDGNINQRKHPFNRWFDWREDRLIIPGSTVVMDFEVYYYARLLDFNTVGEIQWFNQPVPIMDSTSALAYWIAAEFSDPRGDMNAGNFVTLAQQDCRLIYNNSDVPLRQRNNISRRSYGGRGRNGFERF